MKKKKTGNFFFFFYRIWMGYCAIELKAGLGTGRAGRARGTQAGRRRTGAGRVGRAGAGR